LLHFEPVDAVLIVAKRLGRTAELLAALLRKTKVPDYRQGYGIRDDKDHQSPADLPAQPDL
jgi:hypothetical protein